MRPGNADRNPVENRAAPGGDPLANRAVLCSTGTMAANAAKKSKGRKLAVVELDDADQEVEKEEDAAKGIPLFEGLGDEVKIEVYRMEPIEEGTIGTLAPDADEATIARRWGGGVYRVTAKGSDGKFGRKQRTVTIGGDPKFEGKDATRRYKIKMGEIREGDSGNSAPAVPGLDMPGLLSILQASHQNSMTFMQAQLAAQQSQAQAQIAAAAKLADEGRQRDREFFATMLQLQKQDQKQSDPLAMVPLMVKFLELGKDMAGGAGGGGGESDPVTAFIQALPVILPQAQQLLSGSGGQAANQQQAQQPAAAPASGQQAPAGPRLVLTGEIAAQLDRTYKALQAKGYDAEKAMTIALQQLSQVPNAPAKQEPPPEPPPAEEEAPPPAAAAAGNGTTPRARATRRK